MAWVHTVEWVYFWTYIFSSETYYINSSSSSSHENRVTGIDAGYESLHHHQENLKLKQQQQLCQDPQSEQAKLSLGIESGKLVVLIILF